MGVRSAAGGVRVVGSALVGVSGPDCGAAWSGMEGVGWCVTRPREWMGSVGSGDASRMTPWRVLVVLRVNRLVLGFELKYVVWSALCRFVQ